MTFVFGRGPSGVGHPEITDSERRHAGHLVFGRVAEADYVKARVRVAIGDEDDEDGHLLTGWLPMGASRAGGDREWNPLEVDERVMVLSESGELQNGVVMPAGFYTADAPAPGDKAGLWRRMFKDGGTIEYDRTSGSFLVDAKSKATLKVGETSVEVTDSSITLKVGNTSLVVTSSGVAVTGGDFSADGGAFTHGGKNVGKDHAHKNVQAGSAISGPPQ